ncbi:hypothetical protein RHSIM_Rhsim10G0125100 [Rhododendron simsii]|uniref:hAT-like transposase RNase-H fold domain-containing protein n=1 Tax=Rhododendron simsii TaxID=118357 RepID=A0A834GBR7_RHOSS|nr:hypothetical protein RHSIM_Rhsim10G0125100 [Rhododendron simsii]
MQPIFDFHLGGELEDDVVDIEELELQVQGNPNPAVTTLADRLKDMTESILRVRDVVRYVRSSPQRIEPFKKCVEKEKIKSKQTVCLDVCTRWNSTYLMLDVAINFGKAFQRMGEEDSSFIKFFGRKEGDEDLSLEGDQGGSHSHRVPTPRQATILNKLDWKNCSIDESILNRDPFMSKMAIEMKRKFETYRGDVEKFNPLLYVAVALDPQFNLRLVKFCYTRSKGKPVGEKMEKQVKDVLNKLYDFYEKKGEVRQNVPIASQMPRVKEENENCDRRLNLASKLTRTWRRSILVFVPRR